MLVKKIKLKPENASPKSFSILDDQALSSAKFFNFETYSEALARIIQNPNTDTPLVIGIFGEWGSGKTSLMKTIETRIKNLFFVDDINDSEGIIIQLKDPDNPLSRHINRFFSSKFREQLDQYMESDPPSEALKTSLVDEFNAILKKPCIFDKEAFGNIQLTQETKIMVKKNPVSEEDCINVNRRLLEESYPKDILLLGTGDLKDPAGLAMILQDSEFFMNRFPEETKQLLEERRGTKVSPELKIALADGLNTLLIEDHELLESVISIEETQQEILNETQTETHSDLKPLISERIRSNRLVLEKIFPHEIVKGSKNESDQCSIRTIWFNAWKYDKEDALWRALLMRILEDLKVPEIPKSEPVKKSFLGRTTDRLAKPMKKYLSKPLFSLDDTIDPKYITLKLWDDQNSMSRHLIGESEKLQELLKEDDVFGPPLDNIHKIMDEVNTLLKLKPFDFSVPSYMEVSERSKKELHGKDLIRFNRKILEESFWDNNQNKQIEALQASLYKDVYHEEVGDLEFQPKKAFKGTVKLGLSALPLIGDTTKTLFKEIGETDAFKDLMDSVQRTKRIEHIEKVKFKEQFQERFENIIKEFYIDRNKRSVIFIDDLDRCLPDKTIEVIESLKLFLDVKGCIFILGIDKNVVERSMSVKYKDFLLNDDDDDKKKKIPISGKEYLEKIIQLIFPLPPITPSDIEDFIENGLKVDEFYKPYLKMISRGMETNPRKIKRFLNHIELQLNLADTIPDIHRELKFIHKDPEEAQINKKRFMATLIEWAIIRNSHSKFMDEVLKDPNILLKMHQYYKPEFSIDDFKDVKILTDKIRDQDDPKFKYLMDQFEEKTQEIINDYEGLSYEAKQLTSMITDEINKLLNNRNLVHEEPFSTSALKNEIERQINQDPVINNLKFHNKKLIQDVYSEILNMEYRDDLAPYHDNQLLLELIKWFPIKKVPELQDINRVIYLSRVTEGDNIRDKDIDKMDSRREEVIHAIKKGKSLKGIEIQGVDLSGLNFWEKDLSHANFSGSNLKNVKMVRTKLRHAELTDSILEKADLRHTNLGNADLIRANLKEANLKDSVLFNANLKDANLSGANLTNCGLINANLEKATLTGAILINVNLNSAQFDNSTNFMGADINDTTINNLLNTNWKNAKWDHHVFNKIEEKYG